MRTTILNHGWQFRRADEGVDYFQPQLQHLDWLRATVPGSIHLDLAAQGVIPDPFARAYEAGLGWVDEASWTYRTEFEWSPDPESPRRVLRFEGLDTVCTVWLNGSQVGASDNMFVPLEIDVTDKLSPGKNALEVRFQSAIKVGQERRKTYFAKEGLGKDTGWFDERAFVRKAAYMSGWDWGPRLVSCGIWKPIRLIEFTNRIKRASFRQERLDDGRFRVWIETEVDGNAPVGGEFGSQRREPGEPLEFFVDDPKLWWPNREGDPYLYPARVFVAGGDEVRKFIGLREIRLVRDEDSFGRSFEFEVNGRRIWSRGANWVPNDSFLGRDGKAGIYSQVEVCQSLGMNMLRVWGGGVYESEDFYDACDRAGILVWQDFPYACMYYPDGPEEQKVAGSEARENILRLRDRTCLALWCGNNENLAMYEGSWGGSRPPRYYGSNIYDKVLPEAIEKFDPGRDYIPTSPLLPSDESNSDSHYWDVWHGRGDWKFYLDSKTRFSSEFGFASSCSMPCWETVLQAGDYEPRSVAVRWHDKTNKGVDTFEGYVSMHYPLWSSLEDWAYFSQLNQRDALCCGIEHYRRSEFCRGSLIWQFNDCWPVQSWAVQDYRRLLKPAGYELARLYAPVLVSIEIREGETLVHVVNDTVQELNSTLIVEAVSTAEGSTVHRWEEPFVLGAGERKVVLHVHPGSPSHRTSLRAYLADRMETETWRLLDEPKLTEFGVPVVRAMMGSDLQIKVKGYVHDLVIWDPIDPENVFDPVTGQPGWKALTLANAETKIGLRHRADHLLARSLSGKHELRIVEAE